MTLNRQRGPAEPAADAAIDRACRMLRLPTLRQQFAVIAGTPFLGRSAACPRIS